MKNVTSFLLFYVVCFLGLLTVFGCGSDTEETESSSGLIAERPERPQDNHIDVPQRWYKTRDPLLRNEYFRAVLINQFGDIPDVHRIADYQQKRIEGIPVTLDERTAYLQAHVRLWPNERNQETLKNHKKFRDLHETDDPEVFAKLLREQLIKQFGDLPEVDIIVKVEKKFKADEVVSDDEYLAYLNARFRLFPDASTLRELQEALAEQDEE